MNKINDYIDRLLISKYFYIITTIIFISITTIIFRQHVIHWFDERFIVDNELLGTYGDFVGGVLGTIFALISILILIKTLNQQRIATEKNKEQIDNQRFNDLFFELLKLYQSEVAELCGNIKKENDTQITNINYNNKDFFDFEKEIIQNDFNPTTSYLGNVYEALKIYMFFYIKHRTKIAICFRTLYRIYDLIDNSELNESIKKNYLKIIRAQLTDSELFFIRYNAMTYYGNNFVKYINKYNILKHLPTFELLEFKDWWKDLDNLERTGINIIFHSSTRILKRILLKEKFESNYRYYGSGKKFMFGIKTKYKFYVEIYIKIDLTEDNKTMEFTGLEKFDYKKIQALLDCYLKETFIYSNFGKYNIEKELKFNSPNIQTKNNEVIITSVVKNIKQLPLTI